MVALNKRAVKTKIEDSSHLNWMAGRSWAIQDPIRRLYIAASSCFFGEPMYYHRTEEAEDGEECKREAERAPNTLSASDLRYLTSTLGVLDPKMSEWRALTPTKMMEEAIDAALEFNPEETLQLAVRLRTSDNMRTTPQVIMVRAALHPKVRGTTLITTYGPQIIQRLDEVTVQLAYLRSLQGTDASAPKRKSNPAAKRKRVPNALLRAWKAVLERSKDYHLAKYRGEGRQVKLVDVVNLCHATSPAIHKLVKGELSMTGQSWEAIISAEGSTPEAWGKALDVMGHMALLRNLRNLTKKGIPEDLFIEKLLGGVEGGKQLPFRYYSAYKALKEAGGASGRLLDAVEECLEKSFGNLPRFPGRVMSLADNSSSARGAPLSKKSTVRVSTIGNLTSVMTGRAADDGYVGIFGDRLETFQVRGKSSVFDLVEQADRIGHGIGGGTENGIWLFWDQAIRNREHWDSVFIYSDMQAGHGQLYGVNPSQYNEYRWHADRQFIDVPKLISTYRKKVNPNVQVFLVQVAGYQDTLVPEWYDKTYILGGWGDGLLRFAAYMAGLTNEQGVPSGRQ